MTELPTRPARRRTAVHLAVGFVVGVLVAGTVAMLAGAGAGGVGHATDGAAAGSTSSQDAATVIGRSSGQASPSVTGDPSARPTGGDSVTVSSGLPVPVTAPPVTDAAAATVTVALLATLPVKGRAPKTGYDRAEFGERWTDDLTVAGGHNGCDTRNDILRRDLTEVVLKPGSHGCAVLSGVLHDPYSGAVIDFRRGAGTSGQVQIDHVVSLSNAWQTGARQLSQAERTNLANDPDNLQATDGAVNQHKGDGDAATWLPPEKSYRCTYVARQVQVKSRYRLWVTPSERDAILRVLQGCGATTGAIGATTPGVGDGPGPGNAVTATRPDPAVPGATVTGTAPYYSSCAAARSAGVAPLYVGDPGYRPGLDGDRDGIACETR